MNNILVPTDFSDCANAASDYAIEIGRLANARLHFVHIQSTSTEWNLISIGDQKKYPDTLKAIGHSKQALSELIKKAESRGVKAERALIFDAEANELANYINNSHYDLVVMGSHGSSGILDRVMGSNTQGVIRNVEVPVLILKTIVPEPIKRILFVSDFTDVSKNAFSSLIRFADVLQVPIELLYVNTPDQFKASKEVAANMEAVVARFHEEGKCAKNIVDASSIEDGVQDFINETSVGLIAICTHGKGDFLQLFSPSVAEKMIGTSKLPVLSIKL